MTNQDKALSHYDKIVQHCQSEKHRQHVSRSMKAYWIKVKEARQQREPQPSSTLYTS
jgi:tRNA-dihydrouridine synthase